MLASSIVQDWTGALSNADLVSQILKLVVPEEIFPERTIGLCPLIFDVESVAKPETALHRFSPILREYEYECASTCEGRETHCSMYFMRTTCPWLRIRVGCIIVYM